MTDLNNLSEMELDAIKELGNMGVGKAATSISSMLGREIDMSVPQAKIVAISKLHEYIASEFPVAAVVTA
ncbi:MAG: chemotaxis protein CheC, partial [Archaeoglobaceae archaeon]